jgi:hypothetical protein
MSEQLFFDSEHSIDIIILHPLKWTQK